MFIGVETDLELQEDLEVSRLKGLWAAVLDRAIEDLKSRTITGKVIRMSALFYFNDKHNSRLGSFIWICILFKWDPDDVRARILKNDSELRDRPKVTNRRIHYGNSHYVNMTV